MVKSKEVNAENVYYKNYRYVFHHAKILIPTIPIVPEVDAKLIRFILLLFNSSDLECGLS